MYAIRILLDLIFAALILGMTGSLVDLTRTMNEKAIEAHQRGPMSYRKFTKMLTEKEKN